MRNESSANAVIIAVWVHLIAYRFFFIPTLATEASYLNNVTKSDFLWAVEDLCFYIDTMKLLE